MPDEKEKNGDTSDPVYVKHGVESFSVLLLMLLSVVQIVGVLGLFVNNIVNFWSLHDEVNNEVRVTIWSVLFLIFSISGYFKAKISAYRLLLNNERRNITNRTEYSMKDRIRRLVIIPFNSILDIAATVMIVATIVLWLWGR